MQKKPLWLWILGWLIFFPIPLTVLIVRSGRLGKALKGVILTLLWLPIVLLGIAGAKAEPATVETVDKTATETIETTAAPETTVVSTVSETTTTTTTEQPATAQTTAGTTTATEPTARPHREEAVGTSDKDISELKIDFYDSVRNDVTGKWRRAMTAGNNADISEYALSYYNTYFKSDDETHAFINLSAKTTASISCFSGMLFITVYEYVDGEEHDADLLFTGMLLKSYIVYTDNGDIEPIEDK